MTVSARTQVIPSPVWTWATDVLGDLGITAPRVLHSLEGTHSTILVVTGPRLSDQRFAIKVFHPRFASNEVVSREVKILQAFHDALRDRDDLGCPRPLGSSADLACYLMTHEAGAPAEGALRGRSPGSWAEVADRILDGLDIFYGSLSRIYGDFQPNNVLIAPGDRVNFLDPGIPNLENPTFARLAVELRFSPGAVDLGHWTSYAMARSARLTVTHPGAALRRWRFTEELLLRASDRMAPPEEGSVFLAEILRAARAFLAWMRRNTGGRGAMQGSVGALGARLLIRRTTRRLPS